MKAIVDGANGKPASASRKASVLYLRLPAGNHACLPVWRDRNSLGCGSWHSEVVLSGLGDGYAWSTDRRSDDGGADGTLHLASQQGPSVPSKNPPGREHI